MDNEVATREEMLRCVVIGSGGVGGFLIDGLVRQLAFSKFKNNSALVIVDGDNYEPKNRSRQSFSELGNKAMVKASEITPYFPEVFVAPLPSFVVDAYPKDYDQDMGELITVGDLIQEGDIIFAVVDNFATRKIIFEAACNYQNIDIYTGGNDDRFFGSTYHYRRRDGKDVTDPPTDYHPELVNPPDRNPALLSCQQRAELGGSTQLIATNMAVASWLLGRFQSDIIDGKEDLCSEIMFDLAAGTANPYDRRVEAEVAALV